MEQTNLHKQKHYSLIIGGVALIALLLPWKTLLFMNANGIRGVGLISLLGVICVAIASLLGNKTLDYDANNKKLVLAGFGAIALGALLTILTKEAFVKIGVGLWLCLLAGVAGLVFQMGIVKLSK